MSQLFYCTIDRVKIFSVASVIFTSDFGAAAGLYIFKMLDLRLNDALVSDVGFFFKVRGRIKLSFVHL